MMNVVPWLVSMTLLGLQEFAAQTTNNNEGINQISQELEAPLLPPSQAANSGAGPSVYNMPPLHSPSPNVLDATRSMEEVDHFRHSEGLNGVQTNFGQDGLREPSKMYEPPIQMNFETKDDYPGPAMQLVYAWKTVDFEFESDSARDRAIFEGKFVPENNLPLGLGVWRDKVFVTLPKWKNGIPATLATVPRHSKTKSPKLRPYPSWGWHHEGSCGGLTSVFRIQVDECDRLWVLDSGTVNLTNTAYQACPPSIYIFDLRTDRLLRRYQIPEDQVKQDSLWSNLVVDIRNNDCESAVAYLSDVWRFALIVYDHARDSSYRIQHHFFLPDPLSSRYELHGIRFQWMDGIFGISLSPLDINNDRTLFFHPMSSFREFAVSTTVFRDKETAESSPDSFVPIGRPRAKDFGHSSGSAIDRNGVMFFNMVTRDSVWCWDTRKEYIPQNLGVVGASNVSLVFPNDLRVDLEEDQSFWTISNRLPMYLYGPWDPYVVNFRVFRASVKDAVKDTVCDPNYVVPESEQGYDETC
ncbi:protein yellow-like [Venturia canescens]|uniref:protein yellow-like n=1 Tax=Venturia canescens TaxID=32260 RepID=UPI001C9BC00F|nr:protein yellow-like [Venturia canescens]XP_043283694.1 protein yellow-like [Venturia canescens]